MFNFVTFKELLEKSAFLKITAQAFVAGDFLNILLRFWGVFTAHFLKMKQKKTKETRVFNLKLD